MIDSVEPKSNIGFQQFQSDSSGCIGLSIASPHALSTLSSIEQRKNDSLVKRLIKMPFVFLNFVWKRMKYFASKYLFCCCSSCFDPIKWTETKRIFGEIQQVTLNPNPPNDVKNQKVRFKQALSKLSEEALERFKLHIGVCRAEMADSSMTESQKRSWYEKNKKSINFDRDYFGAIDGNTILKKAVRSFWKEIREHA